MSDGAGIAIGIDVGGTKVLAGAVDAEGRLLGDARVNSPATPEELLPAFQEVVALLLDDLDGSPRVGGIGLALPGLVDRSGVLHATPNLGASERGVDLNSAFGTALVFDIDEAGRAAEGGLRLALENDANCAAYAEYRCGAAAGAEHAVVVSLGTGIGAGIISDGTLLRGARSFAGEVGHMIVERDGVACPCGRHGCWERYASGSGLANLARVVIERGGGERILQLAGSLDQLRGEHVTLAAREGDEAAELVIEEFASWIAVGLSNLVELLDPDRFVIGGGLVREADLFIEATRRAYVASCRATQSRRATEIVAATLGEHAACIGAALLSLGPTW